MKYESPRRWSRVWRRTGYMGFTLVEIMIVVLLIGLLLAIAIPNFVNARETSRAKACSENLQKIGYAKDAYMMDNNLAPDTPASTFTDIVLYGSDGSVGYLKSTPFCPGGGTYSVNDGDVLPTCNYGGNTTTHTYQPQ